MTSTDISSLSSDVTELILSCLPIPTLVRATSVCKLWQSIISSSTFSQTTQSQSWFFLYGIHNTSSKNNQSFAFDPISHRWLRLPNPLSVSPHLYSHSSFLGSDGFFVVTAPTFTYSTLLNRRAWRSTSPLHFSRINPLLGVFSSDSSNSLPNFIVVGGVCFIGNLVDIEDRLVVEIYSPHTDTWRLGPPLPADFRSGNSSHSLSSALFRSRFHVLGIYSGFISSFDLNSHTWSQVETFRPPGVIFSFLIACNDRLVLAGICVGPDSGSSFNLWSVDEANMEYSEIAIMPQELLCGLFEGEEEDKFASLKCVGLGNLVYVFNEEYHKKYPACVCEIDSESGMCSWRRVPPLPSPVNKFHQVVSFCSTVSLRSILQAEEVEEQGDVALVEQPMVD